MTKVLFISGSVRNCGKSTLSLSLVHYLLNEKKIDPKEIAYIKPCTQCVTPTDIWKLCESKGVEYIGIGPVVFYPGFTAECVEGKHDTKELLSKVVEQVETLKKNRKFVIVDGVGYPSVGSICGLSNAHIAKALQCPVLLVCLMKDGSLGNTIDNFNQNYSYFTSFNVPIHGIVCNKLSEELYERSKKFVSMYFEKDERNIQSFGFVVRNSKMKDEDIQDGCVRVSKKKMIVTDEDLENIELVVKHFKQFIDFESLIDKL
jgi:dethiobiotin synthetase